MSQSPLSKVNTLGPHQVVIYVVTPTVVNTDGTCTVALEDGDTLTQVPCYGQPSLNQATLMFWFDGRLAVLGLAAVTP